MPQARIDENEEFRHNAFRGFVARDELFYGKIGNSVAGQKDDQRPFDVCIAVEASSEGKRFPDRLKP